MADIINKIERTSVKKGISKLDAKAVEHIGGNALGAISPDVALETIINTYADYKQVVSQEKTKREEISAWRDVELERIASQRELFLTYLECTFDERRANFAKFFEVLDHAVEIEAVDVIAKTLDSITILAKTSPFKDIATVAQIRKVLDEPDERFNL